MFPSRLGRLLTLCLILLSAASCTYSRSIYLHGSPNEAGVESSSGKSPKASKFLRDDAFKVETARPGCSIFAGATSLKYFGFFCSSCDWVGTGSYTEEVKQFANLAFIGSGNHSPEFLTRELQKAHDSGMRAIVSIAHFNFGVPAGSPAGDFYYWWNRFLPIFRTFVENGTIIGFYVSDDAAPSKLFDREFRVIKGSFSRPVVLLAILQPSIAYDTWTRQWLSHEVDWLGFETYTYATPAYFEHALREFLAPHQRLVLVPGVFSGGTAEAVEATLVEATNNPRVVAVIPFLWQSAGGSAGVGARDIPGFRSRMEELGRCFTRASDPTPAPSPSPEPSPSPSSGPSPSPSANPTPAIALLSQPIPGRGGIFQFRLTHPHGPGQILRSQVGFRAGLSAADACLFHWDSTSNGIILMNDQGTEYQYTQALVPGRDALAQNSQCSIVGAESSVVRTTDAIVLEISIRFKPAFRGDKDVFGEILGSDQAYRGYQRIGGYQVEHPELGIRFLQGSGSARRHRFLFRLDHPDGPSQIVRAQVLFNGGLTSARGCLVHWDRASNQLLLMNDEGSQYMGDQVLTIGRAATASNGQCTVFAASSGSFADFGGYGLELDIEFATGFAGQKSIFGELLGSDLVVHPYRQIGTWI